MEAEQVLVPKYNVKTLSDRVISLEHSALVKTIADVKAAIEKHGTLEASRQVLILGGRVLLDHEPAPAASSTIYLFYYEPTALLADPIERAIDWESKNRIKVFKGLYWLSRRKFEEAAPLLLDALSTFTETAFIPFKDCVKYAVITGMLVLDRPTLQKRLVKSPEVLEVIHELPHMESFITSFYNCRYSEFFAALGNLEAVFNADWLLATHTQYIIKEMRVRAYSQMLQAYKSLSLTYMARSFGVTESFIDR